MKGVYLLLLICVVATVWCKITLDGKNIIEPPVIKYDMEDSISDRLPEIPLVQATGMSDLGHPCDVLCRIENIERRLDDLEKMEAERNRLRLRLLKNEIVTLEGSANYAEYA